MLDIETRKPPRCERCRQKLHDGRDHTCMTLEERRDRILAERAHQLDVDEDTDAWAGRRDLA